MIPSATNPLHVGVGGVIGRITGPGQVENSGTARWIDAAIDLLRLQSPMGMPSLAAPPETLYFQ